MAKSPAEILCKPKSMDKKSDKKAPTEDKDKDDKGKMPRHNALIDFIAKNKKVAAK